MSQLDSDNDNILPYTFKEKKPLVYLTDEEFSLHNDDSRYQFDFFDKNNLETVTETKESDIS